MQKAERGEVGGYQEGEGCQEAPDGISVDHERGGSRLGVHPDYSVEDSKSFITPEVED